jgi:molecular chaperone DnaK
LVEAKNQADNLIYNTEKTLKEYGDKVSSSEKESIKSAVERLKKTIQGNDVNAIRAEMDAVMSASHKLAQAMYEDAARKRGGAQEAAGAGAGAGAGAASEEGQRRGGPQPGGKKGDGDDVIDADFEVKR